MTTQSNTHFTLPDDLAEPVKDTIDAWNDEIVGSLTKRLEGIGVDPHLAYQIEIDTYVRAAAMLGITCCILIEGRFPDRARWVQSTTDAFDEMFRHVARHGADIRRIVTGKAGPS